MASVKIIRKIRSSSKAIMYMSSESAFGNFGFWVPKSAIESINSDSINIADWCKIKIIQID